MIEVAKRYSPSDITYHVADVTALPFATNSTDAVIMRMLLHNLLNVIQRRLALEEAHRILRKDGLLVVVEGFPSSEETECVRFFRKTVRIPHSRVFFTREKLENALKERGLEIKEGKTVVVEVVSVRSWLENAVLGPKSKRELWKLHEEMSEECKKVYKMRKTANHSILIDIHFFMITAIRK